MSAALAPYPVDSLINLINIATYFFLGTVCLATRHPCT